MKKISGDRCVSLINICSFFRSVEFVGKTYYFQSLEDSRKKSILLGVNYYFVQKDFSILISFIKISKFQIENIFNNFFRGRFKIFE